jgi:DegV family protein with EDD domain
MRDYIVCTEVTTDLPIDLIETLDLTIIPMEFSFSDQERYMHYPDARELPLSEFYRRVKAGEDTITSQVRYADFITTFEPILEKGQDILYVCFSSGLSGTYSTALLARNDLLEKYPEAEILIMDSLAASMGEGLQAYYAAKNKIKGMTLQENYQWLSSRVLNQAQWFTVDDLYHLRRGGRCSSLAAFMGNMLNIKPLLHTDDQGKLVPAEKIRSNKKLLTKMAEIFDKTARSPVDEDQVVFISHANNLENAEKLAEMIRVKPGVKEVVLGWISPIIGTHCGSGTIAFFYYADHR